MDMTLRVIARVRNDFPTKFGLPRQGVLAEDIRAMVVFEPEYRHPDALRGIEEYSHLWLLWGFSEAKRPSWSATVRPPKRGGNERVGVFASRSPYRPNPIALSCVRLDGVEKTERHGDILLISGVDMMDGTPVYDIKPYLPYADCVLGARGGFSEAHGGDELNVVMPDELRALVPPDALPALLGALARDPRPGYQRDPSRVYGFYFSRFNVRFTVDGDTLTVREVHPREDEAI